MRFFEYIMIGISLSMDASAVNMTNGFSKQKNKHLIWYTSICFGLMQGLMPLIGYFAGKFIYDYIAKVDHWIALILLVFFGGKMLVEGILNEQEEDRVCTIINKRTIMVQGIATSIDALAVGISLAALELNIWVAVASITGITFLLSFLGFVIGRKCGTLLANKAKIVGGIILILIGVKIFVEHVFL